MKIANSHAFAFKVWEHRQQCAAATVRASRDPIELLDLSVVLRIVGTAISIITVKESNLLLRFHTVQDEILNTAIKRLCSSVM
jgi:hypothetical protein